MVQENPDEALLDQRNDSPNRNPSCLDFSTAGVFCRRSLQCPGIPEPLGVKQPQLPIYYQPLLGFTTIVTPFITMASEPTL